MYQAPMTPLIPLPDDQPPIAADDKDDIFATLFSPPTPRASPSPAVSSSKPQQEPFTHSRSISGDSFGEFVSVPPTDDPLHASGAPASPVPFTPIKSTAGFFNAFAEQATREAGKNRHEILDELLLHEDDPLYFINAQGDTAQNSVPASVDAQLATTHHYTMTPPQADLLSLADPSSSASPTPPTRLSPPSTQETPDLPSQVTSAASTLASAATTAASSFLPSTSHLSDLLSHSLNDARSSSPFRTPSTQPSTPSSHVHIPTPARPSEPSTQSYFAPASFSAPTRWVSSILSGAKSPRRTPDKPGSPPAHTVHSASTLPTVLPSHLLDSLSANPRTGSLRVPAKPAGPALDAAITHGTPFAAHMFEGASGAPGFAGDSTWDKGFEFDKTGLEKKSVRLAGRREGTIGVLSVELADTLRPHFPALARLPRAWTLLYSLDQHGVSLNTLYARCASHTGGALLVVQDAHGSVFGAWLGEGIRKSAAYYGSGESFLWRVAKDGRVRVYKWTGKNDYVSLCEADYMSFGGGDGHYGLYIDSSLMDGSSARCPTFENEPLCGTGLHRGNDVLFECVGLEVWGVG